MIQAPGQFATMFDTTKPIGIVVQSDGVLGAKMLGFLPTNNADRLIGMLALFGITGQEVDGLIVLQTGAAPIYVKQLAGHSFQTIRQLWPTLQPIGSLTRWIG